MYLLLFRNIFIVIFDTLFYIAFMYRKLYIEPLDLIITLAYSLRKEVSEYLNIGDGCHNS